MAKRNKRKEKQAAKGRAAEHSRRGFLANLPYIGVGAAALAGGGWWLVEDMSAMAKEHDLKRIGQGTPKVVQIHDPQCPLCNALQREARAAVDDLPEDEICLLVANIRTEKGRAFANSHRVGHVTLLLFDGEGHVVEVLEGRRQRSELLGHFKRLLT